VAEVHQLCLLLQINSISYLLASSTPKLAKSDKSTPKTMLMYEVPDLEADIQLYPEVLDPS